MPRLVHDGLGERRTIPWKMEERSEKSDIVGDGDVAVGDGDGCYGIRMAYWSIFGDLVGYYMMLQMDY